MGTQVLRLDLGWLRMVDRPWPVHGFVVNRAVADALADHGLGPW